MVTAFSMFERPHHRHIAEVLQAFDSALLFRANCFFAGGTAIVLALGEYRESVDIDFICSDRAGYRELRNAIAPPTLGKLLRRPVKHSRDVRTERDKISTFLEMEGVSIRVEFLLEGRVDVTGELDPALGVPVLSRSDMYAEKLLANVDRALDRSTMSRDLIDLAMMIRGWGPIPETALAKAFEAYGNDVQKYYRKGLELLSDRVYLDGCLKKMQMDPQLADAITETLEQMPVGFR
jgi:Nucleotidyl transferase AbiEii toxin, Type IV TA system